jgi:hypothetical protein
MRETLIPRQAPPRRRWEYRGRSESRNSATYWLRYALTEPRDFAYCAPRRIACRLFKHHNVTCRGRLDHSRR